MTKEQIGSLALKLFGVYAWLDALLFFGLLGTSFSQPGPMKSMWMVYLISALLQTLAGAVLFFGSDRLVQRFFTTESPATPPVPSDPISVAEIQVIAFSVVGLAIFLSALPAAVQLVIPLLKEHPLYPEWNHQFQATLPQIIGVTVKLILSLALFLRPRQLVAWWTRKQGLHSGQLPQ